MMEGKRSHAPITALLPIEIWTEVASHLDAKHCARASPTCRAFAAARPKTLHVLTGEGGLPWAVKRWENAHTIRRHDWPAGICPGDNNRPWLQNQNRSRQWLAQLLTEGSEQLQNVLNLSLDVDPGFWRSYKLGDFYDGKVSGASHTSSEACVNAACCKRNAYTALDCRCGHSGAFEAPHAPFQRTFEDPS